MSSFRILSVDGGGIRGIYTAVIIARILKEVPNLINETVLFAGTSTSAMLSLGLAYGIPSVETVELFRAFGKEVLEASVTARVGQVLGAKYDIMDFRKILTPYFGAAVLNDYIANLKKFVLVPTFQLDGVINGVRTWKPKFFHNFPGPDSDAGEMAVDVILRASATPIYFSSYQGYVDGTVVAGNPSTAAMAQALNEETGRQKIEDIRLLSLGTGYYPRYMGNRQQDWGFSRWAWPLISLMLDGDMGVNHYYCTQVLGPKRYYRLGPLLEEPIGMYDAKAIPALIQAAEEVDIEATVKWIKSYYLEQGMQRRPKESEPGREQKGPDGSEAPDSIGIKVHKSEYVRSPGNGQGSN